MSKPLVLTIYPRPRMKASHQGPAPYLDLASGRLVSEHGANMLAAPKRLTEAELCAEFESARCDAMIQSQTGRCWQPLGYTWPMDPESIHGRAQTLLRFAISPHYFEVDE